MGWVQEKYSFTHSNSHEIKEFNFCLLSIWNFWVSILLLFVIQFCTAKMCVFFVFVSTFVLILAHLTYSSASQCTHIHTHCFVHLSPSFSFTKYRCNCDDCSCSFYFKFTFTFFDTYFYLFSVFCSLLQFFFSDAHLSLSIAIVCKNKKTENF